MPGQNNSRVAQGFNSINGAGIPATPLLASKTYAQLEAMVAANGLTVGYYLLTDFATIYDRPDFVDNTGTIEPKGTITTVTAAAEPLILMAVDANSFAPQAYSPSNPADVIEYQFAYITPINSAATKGRIIYRKDTVKNVECSFDFRTITFKFYDHADGRGYVWYYDASGTDASSLVAPFQTYASVRDFSSICDASLLSDLLQGFDLPNFTVATSASVINITALCNTSVQSMEEITADAVSGCVIGDTWAYNLFVLCFDSVFGDNCRNNKIGLCNTNTIGNNMSDNTLAFISDSIIGNNMRSVVGSGFSAQDLSAATIIYAAHSKDISRSPDNTVWLTYTSNAGALTTVVVTT